MDAGLPLPILTAVERPPGFFGQLSGTLFFRRVCQLLRSQAVNATAFEFTPWELGSFDPAISGFCPLQNIGSLFDGGHILDSENCTYGFDNVGFVLGTSSSIFNQALIDIRNFNSTRPFIKNLTEMVTEVLTNISNAELDIASYSPNPFLGYETKTNSNANTSDLHLVDSALDFQNIPLDPLLVPARALDVIFAIDSSADTDTNWPNGTSMVITYERYLGRENGSLFPDIPEANTFLNQGLNNRPTFFGCQSSDRNLSTPLIVYIPNAPYSFLSNISTLELTYNSSTRNNIVENGYDVVTQANGTIDALWPTCVGCAILSRSLQRLNVGSPDVCQECFHKYCWDGTSNNSSPPPYEPTLLSPSKSSEDSRAACVYTDRWGMGWICTIHIVMALSFIGW